MEISCIPNGYERNLQNVVILVIMEISYTNATEKLSY